jgi:cellulose synthase/poly-beta-1,6-N-acetylglucosamine synthase-like glycosyltransferase
VSKVAKASLIAAQLLVGARLTYAVLDRLAPSRWEGKGNGRAKPGLGELIAVDGEAALAGPPGVLTSPPLPSLAPGHGDGLLSPHTLRWLRAGIVLLCLAPVTVLLGLRLGKLAHDPVIGFYGVIVLLSTAFVMFVAFSLYRDPSASGADAPEEGPLVTCLVACKDDVGVIERCVRSMLEQTHRNVEVIAIDDGSTDGSTELLCDLQERCPDRLLLFRNEASVGKKRALTRAAAEAKGEFLVFTDSDCVLDEAAVAGIVRAFRTDPQVGAVCGDARALNAERNLLTKIQDTWYDGQFAIWKASESVFGSVSCVSGPLAAFRREAIWNYLPAWAADSFLGREFRFATDRQLTAYVLGQEWIGRKLKDEHAASPFVSEVDYPERRWRVEYAKSALVWTNVPATFRTLTRQQARWKKSFIRNLCFSARFYWRRGVFPAALYYSHSLFVIATPVMAFRHLIWLPAHGQWLLSGLYVAGVTLKGGIWATAYRIQNPGCGRWIYRPLMSLMAAFLFSALLLWSLVTVRRQVWVRG